MDRIDALRLFGRLAERGSFSAAARDLGIKQSTASKWIASLEAELGRTLVQRTTRSLQITDDGKKLLSSASEVLSAFDQLKAEFEDVRKEPCGRVRVSAPSVFGQRFVVPVVAEFLQTYPAVSVELLFNERYVNLVEEGFDLAVRVGVPADTSARGTKLAESSRLLVASPSYLKGRSLPSVPRDLRQHECLRHGASDTSVVWRFRGSAGVCAVPVSGRVSANSSEAVLQFACRGLGIALLADWLVAEPLRNGTLVPLLEPFSAPPAPVFALRPASAFRSTTVQVLIEHFSRALAAKLKGCRG